MCSPRRRAADVRAARPQRDAQRRQRGRAPERRPQAEGLRDRPERSGLDDGAQSEKEQDYAESGSRPLVEDAAASNQEEGGDGEVARPERQGAGRDQGAGAPRMAVGAHGGG